MTPPALPPSASQDRTRLCLFVRTGRTERWDLVSAVASLATATAFVAWSGCGYYGYDTTASELPADARSDARSTDASMDAGSDAGPSGSAIVCADVPSALVCTGFDDLAGFTVFENDGLAQVTAGVLDTMTTAPEGYASAVATFDPVFDGTLYFRGRMRVVGAYPIVDVNPFMVGNREDVDYGLDFDLVNGGEFRINPSNGLGANSATPLARDTWICLDGAIVLGDENGSAFVRAAGVTIVAVSGTDTLPPSGVAHVSVGIDWTSALQSNARVQWDDFVLARSPVGCP